jgi:hypothetical protein
MSAPKSKKTGLHVTNVSKDHWSVGGKAAKTEGTHLVVTILHGKGLLASDTFTGKSDPLCFLWCGPTTSTETAAPSSKNENENDDFMAVTNEDECANLGILRTKVCPTTLEPIWNEDIIFPLNLEDTYSLLQLRCLIYVRDEDIEEDGEVSYDELGICEINLKDMLINGKCGKQSIVYVSQQLDLSSSPPMKKKAEGYIKVTCKIIFSENDCRKLYPEIGDGIKTLDVFLSKYQQLIQDRTDKENGPKTAWGRAPSPLIGSKRRPGSANSDSETGRGEYTSRTARTANRTARNSRSRSSSPQIAPIVQNNKNNNNFGFLNDKILDKLDAKYKDKYVLLEDVEEEKEIEGEGKDIENMKNDISFASEFPVSTKIKQMREKEKEVILRKTDNDINEIHRNNFGNIDNDINDNTVIKKGEKEVRVEGKEVENEGEKEVRVEGQGRVTEIQDDNENSNTDDNDDNDYYDKPGEGDNNLPQYQRNDDDNADSDTRCDDKNDIVNSIEYNDDSKAVELEDNLPDYHKNDHDNTDNDDYNNDYVNSVNDYKNDHPGDINNDYNEDNDDYKEGDDNNEEIETIRRDENDVAGKHNKVMDNDFIANKMNGNNDENMDPILSGIYIDFLLRFYLFMGMYTYTQVFIIIWK